MPPITRHATPLLLSCLLGALPACSDDGDAATAPGGNTSDGGASGDASMDATADANMPGDSGSSDAGDPGLTGPEVEVTATAGTVVGSLEEGDTEMFLGIPYAKPPVGDLRFAAPEPAEPFDGKLVARSYGKVCAQAAASVGGFPDDQKSEDCLSLNVFAPKDAEGLPVMVFFHGGAFVSGGSAGEGYDGTDLTSQGVVLVTANYRLGALGFLSLPALDDARGDQPSGNDGLLDQRLALQWVRDNIAAFGGDADNVTVFGESAGSMAVCVHNTSPGSAGLADRYIMESGVCNGGLQKSSKEDANAIGQALADSFCAGESDAVACLREVEWSELVEWGADEGLFGAGWAPVLDPAGDVLPEDPTLVLSEGRGNPGEVLLGTNKAEWRLFTLLSIAPAVRTEEEFDAAITNLVGADAVDAVRAQYPLPEGGTGNDINDVSIRMITDATFRCPTRTYARLRSASGGTVYLYSFDIGDAMHAAELSYVFGNLNSFLAGVGWSPELSDEVQGYWTRFAATGDPNGDDAVDWPVYETASDAHIVFDTTVTASSGLAEANCDFWDTLAQAGG